MMDFLDKTIFLKPLYEFLTNKFPDVSEDIILLEILVKLSQIAMLQRLKIRSIEGETFCNLYSIIFAESGAGKDKPIRFIDKHLIGEYKRNFYNKAQNYFKNKSKKLENEADEKYAFSKSAKQNFIDREAPRMLTTEIGNGTMEGLMDYRESLADAGFGGTYIQISELGDYISSNNNSRLEFLTLLTEIFDNGDSMGKVIKGSKKVSSINGVPSTVHLHTSPYGLLEGSGADKLKKFLNRGLARRSLICYPPKKEVANVDVDNAYKNYINALNLIDDSEIKSVFEGFVRSCDSSLVLTLSKDAHRLLFEYKFRLDIESKKSNKDEAVRAEMRGRSWKAQKLSGLIALLEHPGSREVVVSDVRIATSIVEFYSKQFQRFYETKEDDDSLKLYKFLLDNQGTWFTQMDLRQQKFVQNRVFTGWISSVFSDLVEKAKSEGYQLISKKYGTNGYKYRLDSISELQKKANIQKIDNLGLKNDVLKQIFDDNV